jgi:16S rRNA (uracil1498-N3)-methyltransferase
MEKTGITHARGYILPAEWDRDLLKVSGDELYHLSRVLRVRRGDRIEIFNGRGGEGTAEVVALDQREARLQPLTRGHKPPPRPAVTLIQAVIREAHMDWVFQKAVELGASIIAPVWTTRGVVRAAPSENRKRRWEAVVLNAARQSRAAWLPSVEDPCELGDFLARRPRYDRFLVAALDPEAVPLRRALSAGGPLPETVAVLVGPEGDFTADELRAAREAGAVPVTLGERTLRSETAAIYLLSAIQLQFGVPN